MNVLHWVTEEKSWVQTFQEQCLLWQTITSFVVDFGLRNLADLLHSQKSCNSKWKGDKPKKHNMDNFKYESEVKVGHSLINLWILLTILTTVCLSLSTVTWLCHCICKKKHMLVFSKEKGEVDALCWCREIHTGSLWHINHIQAYCRMRPMHNWCDFIISACHRASVLRGFLLLYVSHFHSSVLESSTVVADCPTAWLSCVELICVGEVKPGKILCCSMADPISTNVTAICVVTSTLRQWDIDRLKGRVWNKTGGDKRSSQCALWWHGDTEGLISWNMIPLIMSALLQEDKRRKMPT